MSLFGTIMSKIFPAGHPAVAAQSAQPAAGQQTAGPTGSANAQQTAAQSGVGTGSPSMQQPQGAGGAMPTVDVENILDQMAHNNSQKLNWRTSIVDLMKLVGIDSSLEARKTLAQELHYNGDTSDSAAMNVWLHKHVMQRISQNGGKLPQDLLRH